MYNFEYAPYFPWFRDNCNTLPAIFCDAVDPIFSSLGVRVGNPPLQSGGWGCSRPGVKTHHHDRIRALVGRPVATGGGVLGCRDHSTTHDFG